jgi:hypothetical protein
MSELKSNNLDMLIEKYIQTKILFYKYYSDETVEMQNAMVHELISVIRSHKDFESHKHLLSDRDVPESYPLAKSTNLAIVPLRRY